MTKKKPPKKRRKMEPERFALAYSMIKIKEPHAGVRRIGQLLHLSPTTVQTYLTDPQIIAVIDTDLIQEVTDRDKEKGVQYANDIIEGAFKLNAKRIKELTTTRKVTKDGREIEVEPTKEEWEEARRISLQMLSIARTEADIKRALTSIQFNIDARKQTVNVTQCNRCMDDLVDEIVPCLCKKCGAKIVEVVTSSQPAEVSA